MPDTTITRRRPSVTGALFRPQFFPGSTVSSLARAVDELTSGNGEMMHDLLSNFPEIAVGEKFPALNVSESKTEFTVTAELPGMSTSDVSVDYCDGVLTIKGEKTHEETKQEDQKRFYMWERKFGSFQRALPFPGGIADSKITAEFKNGILTVRLPKAEEEKTNIRKIAITEA